MPGSIEAEGSFTGEFGLGDGLPIEEAPYVIERDRINEARLDGFNRKLLPMKLDETTGERTAGGYYLLDTVAQAKYMFDWYQDPVNGFVLDGIPILQRSYFIKPKAHYWRVIGAHDFKGIDVAQRVVRFERWHCNKNLEGFLEREWAGIRDNAMALDYSAVWLLSNPEQEESIAIVSVTAGAPTRSNNEPDFTGVNDLAVKPSLGECFETENGWKRVLIERAGSIPYGFPMTGEPVVKQPYGPIHLRFRDYESHGRLAQDASRLDRPQRPTYSITLPTATGEEKVWLKTIILPDRFTRRAVCSMIFY